MDSSSSDVGQNIGESSHERTKILGKEIPMKGGIREKKKVHNHSPVQKREEKATGKNAKSCWETVD